MNGLQISTGGADPDDKNECGTPSKDLRLWKLLKPSSAGNLSAMTTRPKRPSILRRLSILTFLIYVGVAFMWNVRQHQKLVVFSDQDDLSTVQFSLPSDGILIVNTRFMQHQAELVDLAWARLELFKAFCLPTMVRQTFRNHLLWIIRTDPDTDKDVIEQFTELIRPYPNFYLVHDNDNDIGSEVKFRELNYTKQDVVSGDYDLLQLAIRQSKHKVLMETILDADDGLNLHLLRHIYNLAVPKLKSVDTSNHEGWAVFCIEKHLEWRSMRHLWNEDENEDDDNAANLGLLQDVEEDFCVTPGLTYALAAEVEAPLIFNMSHMKFHENATDCEKPEQVDCVTRLKEFPGEMAAIRARTTASAGMRNMDHKFEGNVTDSWHLLPIEFGIGIDTIEAAKKYVVEHLVDFSRDNLKGQCAEGHSCKLSSKIRLFRLVQRLERKMKKKDEQAEEQKTKKDGDGEEKKKDDEGAGKKKDDEGAGKKKDDEGARKKKDDEGAGKKKGDEGAGKKKGDEGAGKKKDDEGAGKKKTEDKDAEKKKTEEQAKAEEKAKAEKQKPDEKAKQEKTKTDEKTKADAPKPKPESGSKNETKQEVKHESKTAAAKNETKTAASNVQTAAKNSTTGKIAADPKATKQA